jgi:hypothetical protein
MFFLCDHFTDDKGADHEEHYGNRKKRGTGPQFGNNKQGIKFKIQDQDGHYKNVEHGPFIDDLEHGADPMMAGKSFTPEGQQQENILEDRKDDREKKQEDTDKIFAFIKKETGRRKKINILGLQRDGSDPVAGL